MHHSLFNVLLNEIRLKSGLAAEPYARLGLQMALPQTACLALPGPMGPVPGTPTGRAWFDEEDEAEVLAASALACGARYVLPVMPLLK